MNNLKILGGEGSLIKRLDRCSTAFGKRYNKPAILIKKFT